MFLPLVQKPSKKKAATLMEWEMEPQQDINSPQNALGHLRPQVAAIKQLSSKASRAG
jgi:hypothetical protein